MVSPTDTLAALLDYWRPMLKAWIKGKGLSSKQTADTLVADMQQHGIVIFESRAALTAALGLDRTEGEWEGAIIEWLGPQRMSIEQPKAERAYARGAVIAAAIVAHMLPVEVCPCGLGPVGHTVAHMLPEATP